MNLNRILCTRGSFFYRMAVVSLVGLVAACASGPSKPKEDQPNWSIKFDRPVAFQTLVNDNLLVVATIRNLYGINPETGDTLWRQRNVAVAGNDLTPLGEHSYLLVNDSAGGAFGDRDTNILALNYSTGAIAWESRILQGKILQGVLDGSEKVFYFTTVAKAHGDDRGFLSGALGRKGIGSGYKQIPYLHALDVSTGKLLWTRPFDNAVLLRPGQSMQFDEKDDATRTRPFDLGLYHPPLIAGQLICLTYQGINCYNAHTGAVAWKHRYRVLTDKLALSYANPLLDNGTLITSGDHHVRAYNLADGKSQWRSERLGIVSELLLDQGILYGQLGGQFFNIDNDKWKWKGDFGVVALDRNTGKTLWKYKDAKDGSTNILVYGDKVWLADKKYLIALDRFHGKELYRQKHECKEAPVFAAINEMGQVILVGDGEAAAFEPNMGTQEWYVRHAPLNSGSWSRFSTALMHATGNILKFGSFLLSHGLGALPSLGVGVGGTNLNIISGKKIVTSAADRNAKRLTYHSGVGDDEVGNANLSGNFQYFITRSGGRKKVDLAVLNLSTGKTERMIGMDADHPNLVIDEGNNKIYENFGDRLIAMPLENKASIDTSGKGVATAGR